MKNIKGYDWLTLQGIFAQKKHPKMQIFAKKNDRVRGINFDSIFGVIAHFFL